MKRAALFHFSFLLLAFLVGCVSAPPKVDRVAVDLGAMEKFIGGDGDVGGVGLAKTFRALAAMGYDGVVFDGYWDNDAKTIRTMLADSGLRVCASKVADGDKGRIVDLCEFNLNLGNNLLLMDGATEEIKATAAKQGCEVKGISKKEEGVSEEGGCVIEKNGEMWEVVKVSDLAEALEWKKTAK